MKHSQIRLLRMLLNLYSPINFFSNRHLKQFSSYKHYTKENFKIFKKFKNLFISKNDDFWIFVFLLFAFTFDRKLFTLRFSYNFFFIFEAIFIWIFFHELFNINLNISIIKIKIKNSNKSIHVILFSLSNVKQSRTYIR